MRPVRRPPPRGATGLAAMTPMIDTIFLLLIFFLCTTSFVAPESILPAELPDHGGPTPPAASLPDPLGVVTIRLRGHGDGLSISLNARQIASLEELREQIERLARVSTALPVVIDAGGDVPLGTVVHAYDGALGAGFRKVFFAARETP